MINNKHIPLYKILIRSFCGFCPNCGQGKLFKSYLKPVHSCSECRHEWEHIRADDGPAWLTVFIVAHLFAPFILIVLSKEQWPYWLIILITITYISTLTMAILPRAKGLFIGMIWRFGCDGSEK